MKQSLFDDEYLQSNFFTPKNASVWASEYLGKRVTSSNILYLVNYGKIANYSKNDKENLIDKAELKAYYDSSINKKSFITLFRFHNIKNQRPQNISIDYTHTKASLSPSL